MRARYGIIVVTFFPREDRYLKSACMVADRWVLGQFSPQRGQAIKRFMDFVRERVILLSNFDVTIERNGGYMKKMTYKLLLMTFMAVFAVSATGAGPQYCQGTVGNLYVNSSGTVLAFASYRGDYVQFCNVNVDTGGVSVINCMAWFAMLKSAVQRQSQVLVYYPDAPICTQLPIYGAAPVPGYVMQMN